MLSRLPDDIYYHLISCLDANSFFALYQSSHEHIRRLAIHCTLRRACQFLLIGGEGWHCGAINAARYLKEPDIQLRPRVKCLRRVALECGFCRFQFCARMNLHTCSDLPFRGAFHAECVSAGDVIAPMFSETRFVVNLEARLRCGGLVICIQGRAGFVPKQLRGLPLDEFFQDSTSVEFLYWTGACAVW